MAVKVLYDADILIGAYRLSSDHNSIALNLNQSVVQVPPVFGDTARKVLAGPYMISAEGEGLYQAASSPQGVITTLEARIGVNKAADIVTIGDTKADGDEAYIFKGVQEALAHGGRHGEVNKFRVSTKGAYRYVPGTRLLIAQQTGAGAGTARNLGAVSAVQSIYAALHVFQFVGTTMTMALQSDDASGFSTPTERIAFAPATGITSEWKELTQAITDTWWRASWAGTFTSFTASLVVGIATTEV